MTTQHFQIHYEGQACSPASRSPTSRPATSRATSSARTATIIGEWGYPAPLDDGDGQDRRLRRRPRRPGRARPRLRGRPAATQTSGYIYIDDDATRPPRRGARALPPRPVRVWARWTTTCSRRRAEWAAFRLLGFPLAVDFGEDEPVPLAETVGLPDMSLTCAAADACGLDRLRGAAATRAGTSSST